MRVTRIGLDIAKQIFELHGVDRRGRVAVRKTLRRERVLEYFSQLPACEVALEACGGAHYWHRELSKLGHSVRLLPTHKVKPYLDGNKNNAHDAAAICEASSRPSMRWVEPKTIAQQDLPSLHRVRQVTVRQCTLLANHIRGLLLEYGIAVARGAAALQRALAQLLERDEQRLSPLLKQLIAGQHQSVTANRYKTARCGIASLCSSRHPPNVFRLLPLNRQEPRSRAKRAEATDAAAARAGTRSIVGHRGDLGAGVRRGRNGSGARRVVRAALRPSGGAPGAALRARAELAGDGRPARES